MNKLIVSNLLHRPLRSLISVFAVAIEVIMILSIVGIFMGMLNDQRARTNGIGAELMMLPSGASILNGLSSASMPVNDAIALRRLPHVSVVSPAIQHTVTNPTLEIIYGIDYSSFSALRPFDFLSGGPFKNPNDIIIDNVVADAHRPHYRVGDSIEVMGRNFQISGIVLPGKGSRKLLPLNTLAAMMGVDGKASIFYIKCDKPSNEKLVIDEIHNTPGLGKNQVVSIDDFLSQMTPANLPGFNIALDSVTWIAVIIGFLVIFQAMYTAVLERTREIGILKSMGASKTTIVGVVLRECGVLAVAGVVVGILGTFGVRLIMAHFFPTTSFEITPLWAARGALIAFCGAICGALYPAWMAARKDPVDALAYE
jgi:putative ABC transport system permease protein